MKIPVYDLNRLVAEKYNIPYPGVRNTRALIHNEGTFILITGTAKFTARESHEPVPVFSCGGTLKNLYITDFISTAEDEMELKVFCCDTGREFDKNYSALLSMIKYIGLNAEDYQ